jgi:drug/metabolite transporter (DMT)-like permease
MSRKLTSPTILLLTIPPFLWASNAIVGRMVHDMVPPVMLNFLRWAIALVILLPLASWIYRPGSGLWTHRWRFAMLGLLGIGLYNALQYLALQTSNPINVTLVTASLPVWMLLIGSVFYSTRVAPRQIIGAAMSIAGVIFVLSRGDWRHLAALRFVPGDLFMLVATMVWAIYSWLLAHSGDVGKLRRDWTAFLLAQVTYGAAWSGVFAAGEWALTGRQVQWSWPLAAALLFVAVGPAIIALRCWGVGVQRVGPNIAGFFNNLTPLFAALLSSALLGEAPHLYHAAAFALIVGGIVLSSQR